MLNTLNRAKELKIAIVMKIHATELQFSCAHHGNGNQNVER